MNIEILEAYLIFNKRKNLTKKYIGIVIRESEEDDFKDECYAQMAELLGVREKYNDENKIIGHYYFIDLNTIETKKELTWKKRNIIIQE
jgi:hypothetical protein